MKEPADKTSEAEVLKRDSDLFLVTGKDDFIMGDEGSVMLCRSCFEAEQEKGVAALTKDTFAFKASGFLPAEELECEGYRCCKAHHGPECVDAKDAGYDCQREHQYDERRAKTREKLRDAVLNRRIAHLESLSELVIGALCWAGAVLVWRSYKSDLETTLGTVGRWGYWIFAALVAVPLLTRHLSTGTIRKKLRLPK